MCDNFWDQEGGSCGYSQSPIGVIRGKCELGGVDGDAY